MKKDFKKSKEAKFIKNTLKKSKLKKSNVNKFKNERKKILNKLKVDLDRVNQGEKFLLKLAAVFLLFTVVSMFLISLMHF
jgi:type IV secretory pathway component VirB8